jgi:hypothetical protein
VQYESNTIDSIKFNCIVNIVTLYSLHVLLSCSCGLTCYLGELSTSEIFSIPLFIW